MESIMALLIFTTLASAVYGLIMWKLYRDAVAPDDGECITNRREVDQPIDFIDRRKNGDEVPESEE